MAGHKTTKKACSECGGMFAPQGMRQGRCGECRKNVTKVAGVGHADDPLDGIGNSFDSCIHKVKVLRERAKALATELDKAKDDLRLACQQLADTSDED